MHIIISYSKDPLGLPWRVEFLNRIAYTTHLDINVPSKTLMRTDGAPSYVLECDGSIEFHDDCIVISPINL